ncbi:MAG: hypothetical protein CEE43_07940 [Promethearchaeota archaeon Loki_b32]|nr:MAG: hypothetical protein CEE43_07940 [Candidatus Lokiarchaeota archaeon Loki_b32]
MNISAITKKHSLAFFFILSYLIMIISVIIRILIPIAMPTALFWILTIFSPTISAIFVSGVIGGWTEIKKLLCGFLRWKVGIKWYLAGFLLMLGPLIFAGFYVLFGGYYPGPAIGLTTPILLSNLIFTLLSGPISEEAG